MIGKAFGSVLIETFAVPVLIGIAAVLFALVMMTAPWSFIGLLVLYLVAATICKLRSWR